MPDLAKVKKTRDHYQEVILRMPNVVGIGLGYKQVRNEKSNDLCIVTLVREKIPAAELPSSGRVPKRIDDVLTDVVEVGELVAQADAQARWRPAPPGVSISHKDVTAGTFGCVVRDRKDHSRLILSNNHVLANSNQAFAGDAILQPGAADGGRDPADQLAVLNRFVSLHYTDEEATQAKPSGLRYLLAVILQFFGFRKLVQWVAAPVTAPVTNVVDAAVAKPVNDGEILDAILEIGVIFGTAEPSLGNTVRKFGRTTGLTTGSIVVLDATVTIGYPGDHLARFDHQALTTAMSQGGDSGSLVVDGSSSKAVGLLFAGSEKTTVFTPIQLVLDALDVIL